MASLPSLWAERQWLAAVDVPHIHGDICRHLCELTGPNTFIPYTSFLRQPRYLLASSPLASVQGLIQEQRARHPQFYKS